MRFPGPRGSSATVCASTTPAASPKSAWSRSATAILSVAAGEAHLLNLCVAEAYRCRGIGRRLLAHLLLAAGNAGAREAFLEARPSNTSAIRLYQSLGFTQIGMRRGYYQAVDGREDAIVLKRRID